MLSTAQHERYDSTASKRSHSSRTNPNNNPIELLLVDELKDSINSALHNITRKGKKTPAKLRKIFTNEEDLIFRVSQEKCSAKPGKNEFASLTSMVGFADFRGIPRAHVFPLRLRPPHLLHYFVLAVRPPVPPPLSTSFTRIMKSSRYPVIMRGYALCLYAPDEFPAHVDPCANAHCSFLSNYDRVRVGTVVLIISQPNPSRALR